jgi:hypothetical protein
LGLDFWLRHAMRGVCTHMLQITLSGFWDAVRLWGLCRTCRRFNDWISAVSLLHIVFDLIRAVIYGRIVRFGASALIRFR